MLEVKHILAPYVEVVETFVKYVGITEDSVPIY